MRIEKMNNRIECDIHYERLLQEDLRVLDISQQTIALTLDNDAITCLFLMSYLCTDFSCVWKKGSSYYVTSNRRDYIY